MKNRIYIGVTKKLADQMGIKKLENIENYTPQINFWHASLRFVNRKKCILFMNDLTRYSVFLYGIKKKDLSNLKNIFIDSLIDTMRVDNFPNDAIIKLIENVKEFNIIKTNNRSINGSILDHYNCLPAYLDYNYMQTAEINNIINLKHLNYKLNRVPMMCSDKGFFAVEKMKEILIEGYDPEKDNDKNLGF